MDEKKAEGHKVYTVWTLSTFMIIILAFILIASFTAYIDPLFHYRAPLEKYEYPLNNQRYQNDGITRNFSYDGIITGTSMVENFKTSEAGRIFGVNFIKVAFSGARYKEVNDNLKRAYEAKKELKCVIRCLDYGALVCDKDACREDIEYPTWLYNDNPFDDVNYLLNKTILINQTLEVIKDEEEGNKITDFDAYSFWGNDYTYGAETVLDTYTLEERATEQRELTEEECVMMMENIRQNVTDLADAHPETTFYLFFSPYSICYWDQLDNNGEIDWRIDAEQIAIEEILKHPNIKLYSFCNNFELICNLDNYKDVAHYGAWVNSWILEWIYEDKYLLTEDNYLDYIRSIREFYRSYAYDSLRE